jgi:DNA (cytosine-5)-methyltransferase 1
MNKHKFPYKWYLKNSYPAEGIEKHNKNVFGTFICGGGSTMGYKLAGYNHLGGVEIDPKVADIYKENHKPKNLYIEDLREFNKRKNLPKELYNLDLLDGSPPCSSFSMAGSREKDWGKKKKFTEGQTKQVLDDLVYVYIETIEKLKPKVAILENVKGLIQGNAKSYAKKIKSKFEKLGYRVQVFLLNAASMGVPQKRERVFFIGLRNDFKLPLLKLNFNEKPILFKEFTDLKGKELNKKGKLYSDWCNRKYGDKNFGDICLRTENKNKSFGRVLLNQKEIIPTIVSGNQYIYFDVFKEISTNDICQVGSYPLDYNFKNIKPKYLIGMSVPPVMTAQISHQIYLQWLSKID